MARIDRARFDRADFAGVLSLPVRFSDLDMQGHVNNVAAIGLLEESRAQFNRSVGLRGLLGGARLLVAAANVEYAGEIGYPGTVEIGIGVLALGRTSIRFAQRATQEGTARLYAETVIVFGGADGPVEIPAGARAAYGAMTIA